MTQVADTGTPGDLNTAGAVAAAAKPPYIYICRQVLQPEPEGTMVPSTPPATSLSSNLRLRLSWCVKCSNDMPSVQPGCGFNSVKAPLKAASDIIIIYLEAEAARVRAEAPGPGPAGYGGNHHDPGVTARVSAARVCLRVAKIFKFA
jgi:hypothetical protein